MRQFKVLALAVGLSTVGMLGIPGVVGAKSGLPRISVNTGGVVTTVPQFVGNTFYLTACGYADDATITFSVPVNGVLTEAGHANARGDGCGFGKVTIGDPHISVNNGAPVAVTFGATVMEATGVNRAGQTVTDTIDIPIVASSRPMSSSSGLGFNGADIMATIVGGLALIALGYLILTFVRRRAAVA